MLSFTGRIPQERASGGKNRTGEHIRKFDNDEIETAGLHCSHTVDGVVRGVSADARRDDSPGLRIWVRSIQKLGEFKQG